MAEIRFIVPTLKERIRAASAGIDDAVQEAKRNVETPLYLPLNVSAYLAFLVADKYFSSLPDRFDKYIKNLLSHIPKRDRLKRYDYLKTLGDSVLWINGCLETALIVSNLVRAQEFYGDASDIGKKLNEPDADALHNLAENIPYYLPVFKRIPDKFIKRLIA